MHQICGQVTPALSGPHFGPLWIGHVTTGLDGIMRCIAYVLEPEQESWAWKGFSNQWQREQ